MELSELSTLAAIVNKDEHAERLAALVAQMRQANQAAAEAQAQQEVVAKHLREVRDAEARARDVAAANERRSAALDERQAKLGDLQEALLAEKSKFEEVRHAVEKAQADARARLDAQITAHGQREVALSDREKHVEDVHSRMLAAEASLRAKHTALHKALKDAFDIDVDAHVNAD